MHALAQGPHTPPAPCDCNPCGPWQTALFQDALGDISRCPSLLSAGIMNLAMGVWELNLLPPLAVLSCHLWSQTWKGCSHCKRACDHHLRGRGKLPLQHCLPILPLGSFLPEYSFVVNERGVEGRRLENKHLWPIFMFYVLCFLFPEQFWFSHSGHDMTTSPIGWSSLLGVHVCLWLTYNNLNCSPGSWCINCKVPSWQWISNSILSLVFFIWEVWPVKPVQICKLS